MKHTTFFLMLFFLVSKSFSQTGAKKNALLKQMTDKEMEFDWMINADTLLAPETVIKQRIVFTKDARPVIFSYWVEDSLKMKKNNDLSYDITEHLPEVLQTPQSFNVEERDNHINFIGGESFVVNVDSSTHTIKSLRSLQTGKLYKYIKIDDGIKIGN